MLDRTGRWEAFYDKADESLESFAGDIGLHAPYLGAVAKGNPARALEAGAGTARHGIFLSRCIPRVVVLDASGALLASARDRALRFGGSVEVVRGSADALPFEDDSFDVVFNQGVLEHYDDVRIARFVREALRVAPRYIASMPSDAYKRRDLGDERLLAPYDWRRILDGLAPRISVTGYAASRRWHGPIPGRLRPTMVLAVLER